MRAIGFDTWGGPEVLHPVTLPDPVAGEGEILVRVAAAGVAPVDVMARTGLLAAIYEGQEPPFVVGMEIAGTVEALGLVDDALALPIGTPVVAFVGFKGSYGGYSELLALPAASVVRAPRGLSMAQAATTGFNPLTARNALDTFALPEGSTLLVTGAAGAVGGYTTELASREGIRVIAQARPEEEELVLGFGATDFVPRGADLAETVRAFVPEGVDAVLDTAGIGLDACAAVRDRGQYTMLRPFGEDAGRGVVTFGLNVRQRATDHEAMVALRDAFDDGRLTVREVVELPACEAVQAHRLLDEHGAGRARVVLDMSAW